MTAAERALLLAVAQAVADLLVDAGADATAGELDAAADAVRAEVERNEVEGWK